VEVRVTQPIARDAVKGRGRNDAGERARNAEACVIGDNEQYVGSALGRDHPCWPVGLRFRRLALDPALKHLRRWRKLGHASARYRDAPASPPKRNAKFWRSSTREHMVRHGERRDRAWRLARLRWFHGMMI
jgi:hypothetical protein